MEGVALRARNLSKSFQNQTESARYAWKDSANRGQSSLLELLRCSLSYGNYSKFNSKLIKYLFIRWRMKGKKSLYEREINQKLSSKIIEFHSTFSRHGNTQASLHCSFGL